MSNNLIDRRKFIANSVIGLGGLVAVPSVFAGQGVSSNKTVRIGIVGTGKRGLGLINTIETIPGLEVVACCDIIPDNLSAALAKASPKAKGYTDYEKMLTDKNIDAVIVSTPLYLHYPMSVAALEMKKHVYVEKSMTFTIEQSLDLVKRIRNSKQVLQVGFQYRNYGLYHKVKEFIQRGGIGDKYSIECNYNRRSDWKLEVKDPKLEKTINWRLYRDMCGGLLSELCAHQIDIINYITGSHPAMVLGVGGTDYFKDGRGTTDNVRAIYEYANGVKATYASSLVNTTNTYEIKIFGNEASIEIGRNKAYLSAGPTKKSFGIVDGVTGATVINETPGKKVELPYLKAGEKYVEPTVHALQNFYDCVVNGKTPLSNVETGKDTAIAICMGLDAIETKSIQYWKPEYSV